MTRSSGSGKQVYGRISIVPEEFGRVIAQQRKELGLSLRDLADAAGVSLGTVQSAERGDIRMGLENFLRILGALNLVPENIVRVDNQLVPATVPLEEGLKRIAADGEAEQTLRNLVDLLKAARNRGDKGKPKKRPS